MTESAAYLPKRVTLPKKEVAHKLQTDTEFALKFFLGDKLEYEVGEFQKEVFPILWQSTSNTALAIPRGFTKTTMAKIATVLALYFREFKFGTYVRESMSDAIDSCSDIIRYFKCDNWVNTFGMPVFEVENRSDGLWIFTFPGTGKTVILKASSYKSSNRGKNLLDARPDYAVLDDIDQREDSEAVRAAKSIWFWSTFSRGMKMHGSLMLYLGNLTSDQGILQELIDDDEWNSYHYGVLKSDGNPLWPEAMSLAQIKKDFLRSEKKSMLYIWFQEMMNIPIPAGAIIDEKAIQYIEVPEPETADPYIGFAVVDLAISMKSNADEAAIVYFLWIPFDDNKIARIASGQESWAIEDLDPDAGYWVPVETFNQRNLSIFQLFDKIYEMGTRWKIDMIFIENVAYQAAALQFYPYLAKQEGWFSASFSEVCPRNRTKSSRIQNWARHITDQIFALPRGSIKLTQMLLKYTPKKSDIKKDLLDACAYSCDVIMEKRHEVIAAFENAKQIETPALGTQIESFKDLLARSRKGTKR